MQMPATDLSHFFALNEYYIFVYSHPPTYLE